MKKNNQNSKRIAKLDEGKYRYNFPLKVFCTKRVNRLDNIKEIKKALLHRNIYYNIFDDRERKLLLGRINSLKFIINFLLSRIEEAPSKSIVSVYVYGSYLFGVDNSLSDDIDVGVIIKGSAFKYVIDKIKIPSHLRKYLVIPVKRVSLFFYGKDNMELGLPIDDTVIAGLIHKQAVKRELSIAYWRNVVIWGRDFKYITGNEKNVFVTIARMLNGCRERLLRYGHDNKEDKRTLLRKVVTRLVEVNVFLEFFNPHLNMCWKEIFELPRRVERGLVSYEEIKKVHETTMSTYNFVKRRIIES